MTYSRILMCHAPIVLEQIAGERFAQVRKTNQAMTQAASYFVSRAPDLAIVVSPHTPRLENEFVAINSTTLGGDFGDFGFPEIAVELPSSPSDLLLLQQAVAAEGVRLNLNHAPRLDHGAMVPLHFLTKAGWQGPTIVIGLPLEPTLDGMIQFGRGIARYITQVGKHVGVVASGDMSHRLQPGAPAGYSPKARHFDRFIVDALAKRDLSQAVSVGPQLRHEAAEDIVDSLAVAYGMDSTMSGPLYSYEGPFGVGYAVSVL